MFKLIILALVLAFTFGILSYDNEKLVIDTVKGKELMSKGKELIEEKVEVK